MINIREFLLLAKRKSLRDKPTAIEPKIPKATNFGRLTGSIEFQGETKIETAMDVKITYELSNLEVGNVSTPQEYSIPLHKGRSPVPSEEGTGLRF
jgi:hypothetical protein